MIVLGSNQENIERLAKAWIGKAEHIVSQVYENKIKYIYYFIFPSAL